MAEDRGAGQANERLVTPSPAGTADPAAERGDLEIRELRLKVRDLEAPWWRRPSVAASLATILAAAFGIIWGIVSGFFSVSLKELQVQEKEVRYQLRELGENRDKQARLFAADAAHQRKIIDDLKKQTESLQKRLAQTDVPSLQSSSSTFVRRSTGGFVVNIFLSGRNLGEQKGTANILVVGICGLARHEFGTPPYDIGAWSDHGATILLQASELIGPKEELRKIGNGSDCTFDFEISLRRRDGLTSNLTSVEISSDLF